MPNNRNTTFHLLLFSTVLFLFGFVAHYLTNKSNTPEKYAEKLQTALQQQEYEIDEYFRQTTFLEDAIHNRLGEEELNILNERPYTLCIYQADSLLFWSNNKALAYSTETAPSATRVVKKIKLKKKHYELIKDRYTDDKDSIYTLVGLIPIYYEYNLENDYLKKAFALDDVPSYVQIGKLGAPVENTSGQELFYVLFKGNRGRQNAPLSTVIFYLLAFFTFILALTYLASTIIERYGSWVGVPFFIVAVVTTRVVTSYLGFTSVFSDYDLFSPHYYAFNDLTNSLGDLFINVILLFWICVYVHRQLRFRHLISLSDIARYATAVGAYALIFGAMFLVGFVYKSLVLDSEISLEIDNISTTNIYSFVGLLSVTILAVAFFFLTHKLMLLLTKLNIMPIAKLIFAGIVLGIFTLFNVFNVLSVTTLFLILFAVFVIVLFEIFIRQKSLSLGWLLGWIIIFSLFSSFMLYQLNREKHLNSMRIYAERLSKDNDYIAERQFNDILNDIRKDNLTKKFFKSPFMPRKQVIDRMQKRYIEKGYLFNRYNYNIHLYNPNGNPVRGEIAQYDSLLQKIDLAIPTSIPDLHLWSDDEGNAQYIADVLIRDKGMEVGKFVIVFFPKKSKQSKVYSELLLDSYSKTQKAFNIFDYAIYKKGVRVAQKDKSFGERLEFYIPEGSEFYTIVKGQKKYFIYRPNADKVVVVAGERRNWVKGASLFSYMFCLQFAVFLLMVFINRLSQALPAGIYKMNFSTQTSLRSRINISVISVITLSFTFIGLVTVLYFQREFEEYHKGRLERKVRGVLATANSEMKRREGNNFLLDVEELSAIHSMDIDLYGLDGELRKSSQDEVLKYGLISNKMNPLALYYLRNLGMEQYTHSETISDFEYLAAYVPLYNKDKQRVAYIGLPYFSRQANLRQDVSGFMGTLLNVYVLLFLVAGVVALFVGNSVTRPIVAIGEKLKAVKLGKKNEPIVWENEDEIGALVSEYNKMIKELEESARLLAQSNREFAWREMARQVAHEIKNPLTPMRLSIQHLQRVYESDPNQINRLSKTILEQIDNLSHIASEFSNFAKMPKARNEYFVLDELVISVYDLFKKHDSIKITLEIPDENTTVFADKKQMMRVFNNLIKNAIQAIPEDRPGNIDIAIERLQETVIAKIIDNGVGIPEEKQASIFVPNFTTKNSGMGLGLAISRNIIESPNGTIYFSTEENVGTTFYVELPIKEAVEKMYV